MKLVVGLGPQTRFRLEWWQRLEEDVQLTSGAGRGRARPDRVVSLPAAGSRDLGSVSDHSETRELLMAAAITAVVALHVFTSFGVSTLEIERLGLVFGTPRSS